DLHRAAKLFAAIGQRDQSMKMFSRLASTTRNLSNLHLEDNELAQIVDYLGEGHSDDNLTKVILGSNKLVEVLMNLVHRRLVKQASELLLRATSDIAPQLIAEVSYQDH